MWRNLLVLALFFMNLNNNIHDVVALSIQKSSVSFATGRPVSMAKLSASPFQGPKHKSSNALRMHFGHSHAHHDHHHSHSHHDNNEQEKFTWKKNLPNRRKTFRILFSALVTLIPPLFFRQQRMLSSRITNTDIALFLFTSATLTLSQKVKQQVKAMITNAKRLRDGVIKHSSRIATNLPERNRNFKSADRVTYIGLVCNLLLSIGKAVIGVTCHSAALVADAGHSLSDLFSDFITLWAVQIGRLPPDDDHPYGHGKFESIGSLFLSLTLLGTGFSVGAVSYKRLMEILSIQLRGLGIGEMLSSTTTSHLIPEIPTFPCLVMAMISILSKEWLYRITRNVGEKLNSQVVIANAWHHRSDAYSSVLALGSIGLAMTFPSLIAADSAMGLVVAGMISITGFEIMNESIKQLTDTNNEELVSRIHTLIEKEEMGNPKMIGDVIDINQVRARQVGSAALVDVKITTAEGLSTSATRAIEDRIKWRILEEEGRGSGESVGIVLDAEVHATTHGTKSCPLLFASSVMNHDGGSNGKSIYSNGKSSSNGTTITSAAMVEEDARSVLERDPRVQSVEKITVHYHDTLFIDVDAQIRLIDSDTITVAHAQGLAKELRNILELDTNIQKANIFLDLNEAKEDSYTPMNFIQNYNTSVSNALP